MLSDTGNRSVITGSINLTMLSLNILLLLFAFKGTNSRDDGINSTPPPLSILFLHSMFPSHYYPLISLGAELVARGHRVTSFGVTIEGYEHLPEMITSYGMNYIEGTTLKKEVYESYVKHTQGTNISGNVFSIASDLAKVLFKERYYLLELIKATGTKLNRSDYDYIIGEHASLSLLYYLSKEWETDNVMLVTLVLGLRPHYIIPWPYPKPFAPFTDNMSFLDRFLNTAIYFPLQSIAVKVFVNALVPDGFHPLSDPLLHLINQPTLYTTVIGVERPVTILPTQHYVGPMLLPNRPPLDSKLLSWLDENEPHLPVIYISTGTIVHLSASISNIILSLADDYRLVWAKPDKLTNGNGLIEARTDRVYITKWVEQCSLLRNPSVKLALLHCGVSSVHEALYYGVPVLCIPQGGDQYDVGFRITSQQLGISIRSNELTIDKLKTSVDTLLNGDIYKKNVKRVSRLLREGGGAKRSADLVELYAAVGYDHALPPFIRNEWGSIKFYNLDVWVVLMGVVVALVWGCGKCCRCLRCSRKTK